MAKAASAEVDAYIASHPKVAQRKLKQMRATISKAAQTATELMSYGIPAFKTDKMLVWFAAFKKHIGFYPGADAVATFKKELSRFKFTKGSIRFPVEDALPLQLVARMVRFRVRANKASGNS